MSGIHPNILVADNGPMTSTGTTTTAAAYAYNASASTAAGFDPQYGAEDSASEYAFERWDVKATFLTVYSIVFFSCFIGNLMVILVVTLHWRMRSVTNFCLANLAFADLCVAIFCVYQNLYMYIMKSWVFGAFLCKMYFFITELSHTASILILVVICIERYLAIIHPMRCKEWLTLSRLRITIICVWGLSAIYSSPKLLFSDIISHTFDEIEEIICIPLRITYDSKLYDVVNFGLLFALPLSIITVLYSKIGLVLWQSSHGQMTTTSNAPNAGQMMKAGDDEIANEPTSSSSSNGMPDGANNNKKQVSCAEVLCCGTCKSLVNSTAKCCVSCTNIFGSTKSLPNHGSRLVAYPAKADDNQANYYFPTSTPIEMTNMEHHNRPTAGILKTNANYNHSLNGSVSSSSSSSNGGSEKPKISSTEPIVVVRFDGKKNGHINGHGRNGKNTRAHCTILMKASTSDNQLQSALVDNGDENNGHGLHARCENESPIASPRQANSVAWSDKLIEQNGTNYSATGNGAVLPRTSSVKRTNSTRLSNGGSGRAVRRMRVIRSCTYGTRALKSRRRVIRMLVVIVFVFALCNLPFHARKMWQYWGSSYSGGSTFSNLFTPITFLIMYLNSAINPILYAFLSKKFRLSFWDLITCRINRSLKMARNASVRSTHVVHMSTAGT